MTYNPQQPARRSPRLKGYDYSQEGAYFVTVCTQHRIPLFGEVVNGEICLNVAGKMIAACWEEIPMKFSDIELDLYCVMPNHFHGIIVIVRDYRAGSGEGGHSDPPLQGASLLTVMQRFKSLTTHAYMRGVQEQNWESFQGKLWQRSFHDHIIRSETSLNFLRAYTQHNPARWEADEFYG